MEEVTEKPVSKLSKKHKDLLKRAMNRLKQCEDAESANRKEALEDFRFAQLGKQWEDDMLQERQGRPCLTVNKLAQYINQVVNEQRQAKQGIKVIGVDSQSDKDVADIQTGLIRNIEYLSKADLAYETAYEHAVTGGFGFFGVETCYADEDTFDQDIRIRTFENCFAVHIDPASTMPDGSDMEFAFVTDKLTKEEFEARFPDEKPYDPSAVPDDYTDAWHDEDTVYVREYWERSREPVKLTLYSDGITRREGEQVPAGVEVVREREAKEHKVRMYVICGDRVLSESGFPSRYIPIFPVYGKRLNVAGLVHIRGLVRFARDAQKMFNWWRSSMAERIALVPKAPYLVEAEQVEGYENIWQMAASTPLPYLPYKRSPSGNVPTRAPMGDDVSGIILANQQAEEDIKSAVGIYDPQLGMNQGNQSGRAILALQKQGDTSTYGFQDNLARAKAQCGRVIVELIGKLYDTERIVRVLGEDGATELVRINQRVPIPGGDMQVLNDVTVGKYDVEVTTGPSFATKRMETTQAMLDFIQSVPQAGPILAPDLAKMQDWPGAEDLAQKLSSLSPTAPNPQAMAMQVAEQAKAAMAKMEEQYKQELDKLKASNDLEWAKLKLEAQKVKDAHEKTEIERLKATGELISGATATLLPLVEQTVAMALANARQEEAEEASGEDDAFLDAVLEDAAFPDDTPAHEAMEAPPMEQAEQGLEGMEPPEQPIE